MNDRVLVRAQFDPDSDTSVAVSVVETLSLIVDGYDDLPPLATHVDTDSLDSLFSPHFGSSPPEDLQLSFPYEDWLITVSGKGEIVVSARPGHEIYSD
jgi:hypothetical protein